MKLKDFLTAKNIKLRPFHNVAFALLTALFAEFIFQHFIGYSEPLETIGRVIILFLSIYIIDNFSTLSMVRYNPSVKDLFLFHSILIASVFILWFGKIFAIALSDYLMQFETFKQLSPQALHYAIPFAFGGLLIQAVKGLNYGLVFSVCFALIVGFYLPNDLLIIPYVLVTTLIACLSIENFRSRSEYLKAGLKIGLIAIPFSLVALIIKDQFNYIDVSFTITSAFIGGFLAVIIAAGITPFLEHLGGYVTDLRLIEMSTLDHPLLKDLSIQAPGTWNHSMVMGMMVEDAAGAVGANPILARTGAYFHDVGKIKKPAYFVENQMGGANRHDKLSPSMSALIIKAHVKDGVELAKEHKIPGAIRDLIQQHHGTSTIEYFYNKACKDAEESEDEVEVDKSLYTYPGPKPQTREAGILMLADVIESSSRVIPDLTQDKIQMHVQKTINRIFASGQLEECDLTLKDLHKIARCFTRILNSIHHQRIAYDEEEKGKRQSAAIKSPQEGQAKTVENKPQNGSQNGKDPQPETKDDDPENLKRLGIEFHS